MNVRDAMTADVRAVGPTTSLKDVAAILAAHNIGGVPVVDGENRVIGVVSKADILVKDRGESPFTGLRRMLHRREASAVESKIGARTAGDAMTTPAVTVGPSWSLASAAEVLIERGVNRLPVTEAGDTLVGIVTRHDLVRAFARSDTEIEREIRDEAFRGLAWTDALELSVNEGEVTLRGELDTRVDAEGLPSMVRRVPGVVSVDSDLTAWDGEAGRKVAITARL